MMRHEHDEKPVLIDTLMNAKDIKWNINGTVLAVTGSSAGTNDKGETKDNHLVQVYSLPHLEILKS